MTEKITVRDRRQVHQFSIHNWILDEWAPIIGSYGFMLYSLYVRMASNDEERSYPGYRTIQAHFGIGPATISDYNKLLEWCGLIYIAPGNTKESNDYYILDIPKVTPERLAHIRTQAEATLSPSSKFREQVLTRLADWKPIQAYWGPQKSKPIVVHPDQISLPLAEHPDKLGTSVAEHPASPAEEGATPAEHPASPAEEGTSATVAEQSKSTILTNNPNQQGEGGIASTQPARPPSKSASPPPPLNTCAEYEEVARKALTIYTTSCGLKLDPIQSAAICELIKGSPDFSLTRWQQACFTVHRAGVKPANIDCRIDTYKAGGDYQKMQEGRTRGRAIAEPPASKSLDDQKREAWRRLQAESEQARAETAARINTIDFNTATAVGVDVAERVRQTTERRRFS